MAENDSVKTSSSTAQRAESVSESSVAERSLADGASGGTLLKRREAAKRLGWSESKLRRNEGTLLNPIVAPDGVHLFRAEEIETIRRVRVDAQVTPADYDGPTAARVFAYLDEGVHPVEIVRKTSLDPRAVAAIHDEWAKMLGGFVVTERHLVELELLPWLQASFPMRSPDALVAAVRDSTPGECVECKKNPADLCGQCVTRFTEADEAKRIAAQRGLAAEATLRRGVERNHARWNAHERRTAQRPAPPPPATPRSQRSERNRSDATTDPTDKTPNGRVPRPGA